jgi:nucleotide-binding universal stress UspA family protein
MFDRIVIGYDDSESSKAALREASLWADGHGGALSIVHAVYFDAEEFAIPPAQIERGVERATRFCREAQARTVAECGGLAERTRVLVREGEAPAVLARVAAEERADLVALGTFGRSALRRLLVGSVTAEVVLESPCDVLVVKRPCGACNGRYTSILVAFDRSESSKKALVRAAELAKAEGAKLTVLYVIPRYEEMVEFLRTDAIEGSLRAAADKVLAEARAIATAAAPGLEVATRVGGGHAADEILAAARQLGSDLVVMGTHGWTGVSKAIMGSTTSRVITHATSPVLVVKQERA